MVAQILEKKEGNTYKREVEQACEGNWSPLRQSWEGYNTATSSYRPHWLI